MRYDVFTLGVMFIIFEPTHRMISIFLFEVWPYKFVFAFHEMQGEADMQCFETSTIFCSAVFYFLFSGFSF